MGFYVGWYRDSHFLVFFLILISALKYIRYMMTYSTDVRNVFTVISSFGDLVEKCCTESNVNYSSSSGPASVTL